MTSIRIAAVVGFAVVTAVTTSAANPREGDGTLGSAEPTLLARWNGGELTQERFLSVYDPTGEALGRGGIALDRELCKAIYQEIYGAMGERLHLDREPEMRERLDQWERERLVNLYVERYGPAASGPPTEEMMLRFYEQHLDEFRIQPTVDLQVLFFRCSQGEIEDGTCETRMSRAQERRADGEEFLDLVLEERRRSGNANGEFNGVLLSKLAPELVEAIRDLPAGGFSEPIVGPSGIFLLRVSKWGKTGFIPMDRVSESVKSGIAGERMEHWRSTEVSRLRKEAEDIPADETEDTVLIAAAVEEGIDREPTFLRDQARHRAWKLADAAFFRDSEVLPHDEEIGADLLARGEVSMSDRIYDLEFVVVSDSGPDDAIHAATALLRNLRSAPDLFEDLDDLLDGWPSTLRSALEGVDADQLQTWNFEVARALDASVRGEWLGPFQLKPGPGSGEDAAVAAPPGLEVDQNLTGVVLVGVSHASVPISDDQRQAAYRRFRSRITTVEGFIKVFDSRWGLVILSADHADSNVELPVNQ